MRKTLAAMGNSSNEEVDDEDRGDNQSLMAKKESNAGNILVLMSNYDLDVEDDDSEIKKNIIVLLDTISVYQYVKEEYATDNVNQPMVATPSTDENFSCLCEGGSMIEDDKGMMNSGFGLNIKKYEWGNHQSVKLNSQEISAKSDLFWNEFFSLDCMGTQDSINMLKQGTVVFELRSRKYFPLVGGSQLLGRAEIPWRRVFETTEMEIVEWAMFMDTSKNISSEDVKPPAVKIAMKVKVKGKKLRRSWDESCSCKGYCGCNSNSIFSADDYEIFALGAALDAL
ncbi:hypothetical protein HAX54_036245 [Datura stramonium]|uniref:Uncharacterized protein n=1 Tax=Datura stramonium TaxID=4076 RepID=A0ABS8SG38_DATST|nr:hypothetical protein [Datura stramonium]